MNKRRIRRILIVTIVVFSCINLATRPAKLNVENVEFGNKEYAPVQISKLPKEIQNQL